MAFHGHGMLPSAACLLAAMLGTSGAFAQTDVAALEQRLAEQEQRIRVLERKLELQQEATTAAAAEAPVVRASPRGFTLQSQDGSSQIRLRGLLHFDGREFRGAAAPPGSDTFTLARVRPLIEGSVGGMFDYRFTPDFGNGGTVIQDAYVVARVNPGIAITAGKFKTPFGIERLQSSSDLRFVQRALPNNLVPNRDLGLQLGGDLFSGHLTYALGYLNGVNDGSSTENNATPDADKDIAIRFFAQPFRSSDVFALQSLSFGVAATYADNVGSATRTLLPTYRSPGQQTVFAYRTGAATTFADGERLRWSPQFYYANGSLGVLGEYVAVSQDVARATATGLRRAALDHDAWQVSLGWFLTGEEAGYRAPAPKRPITRGSGQWGALELTARVSALNLDPKRRN